MHSELRQHCACMSAFQYDVNGRFAHVGKSWLQASGDHLLACMCMGSASLCPWTGGYCGMPAGSLVQQAGFKLWHQHPMWPECLVGGEFPVACQLSRAWNYLYWGGGLMQRVIWPHCAHQCTYSLLAPDVAGLKLEPPNGVLCQFVKLPPKSCRRCATRQAVPGLQSRFSRN